jgi:endogenous inhibitor of DNA gyrase (YacG/DUF329 family)
MKVCSVDGCEKPIKVKSAGLCKGHYTAAWRAKNGREKDRTVEVPCTYCGKIVTRSAAAAKRYQSFCSYRCRDDHRLGTSERKGRLTPWVASLAVAYADCSTCGEVMAYDPRQRRTRHTWCARKPGPRFVDATCDECGERFTVDRHAGGNKFAAVYCSKRCQRRYTKRTRRGREHGRNETYRWTEVIGVWLSLGKRCAYCHSAMNDQPEPDHVVPLSRGGRNDIANILPCCRACNADKNDRTLDEWAQWRAERGKPAVTTDYVTYDPRAPHLVLREAAARRASAA